MGFYEKIKERYKNSIDKETGLLKEQKIQLDGLIMLLKSMALQQSDVGKCEFFYDFGCNHQMEHFVKGEDVISLFDDSTREVTGYDSSFKSSDIYYLFAEKGLHEILMAEIRTAFGPEFTIEAAIQSSEHRSNWLEVHVSWPLPKKEGHL